MGFNILFSNETFIIILKSGTLHCGRKLPIVSSTMINTDRHG